MARIGLRDLYFASVTTANNVETFGTPERLAKAISADISVEIAEETLYADDAVDEIAQEFIKGILKLNVNDIEPTKLAALLNQYIDADGVIFAGENDDAPYVAIGFRAKKTGGKYRYIWLYKVKFKIPSEAFETKGDGISFKTPEIEGEFIKRESDGMWKADYVGLPDSDVAQAWFDAVKEYVEPVA